LSLTPEWLEHPRRHGVLIPLFGIKYDARELILRLRATGERSDPVHEEAGNVDAMPATTPRQRL